VRRRRRPGVRYIVAGRLRRPVNVEFECVVCGETATAGVPEEAAAEHDGPLETLRECPNCELETIWVEC